MVRSTAVLILLLSSTFTTPFILYPNVGAVSILHPGSIAEAGWQILCTGFEKSILLCIDPPYPAPFVFCSLKVGIDFSLTLVCHFYNSDLNRPKRFVMCAMIGLTREVSNAYQTYSPMPVGKAFALALSASVISCTQAGTYTDEPMTWHLGCKLVSLAPGEKNKILTWSSGLGRFQPPLNGMGDTLQVKAHDFMVHYYDIVDLTNSPSTSFNAASCLPLNGQNYYVDPGGYPSPLIASWREDVAEFSTPNVASQSLSASVIGGLMHVTYLNLPCIPNGFETNAPLKVCPPPPNPRLPFTVDLNLFDYATMRAPPGTNFPAFLNFTTSGDTAGLRVETNPAPNVVFNMTGRVSLFGQIKICSTTLAACLVPDISEGRMLNVTVNFYNATTGGPLFDELLQFVHDSMPPVVTTHSVSFDPRGDMLISVTANDTTTSPIDASLFFTTDGGATWNVTSLQANTDISQALHTRTFTGSAGPFKGGTQIRYFISIQDVVSNLNYYGVGQATVPSRTPLPPVVLLLLALAALVTSRVAKRRRRIYQINMNSTQRQDY